MKPMIGSGSGNRQSASERSPAMRSASSRSDFTGGGGGSNTRNGCTLGVRVSGVGSLDVVDGDGSVVDVGFDGVVAVDGVVVDGLDFGVGSAAAVPAMTMTSIPQRIAILNPDSRVGGSRFTRGSRGLSRDSGRPWPDLRWLTAQNHGCGIAARFSRDHFAGGSDSLGDAFRHRTPVPRPSRPHPATARCVREDLAARRDAARRHHGRCARAAARRFL